MAVKKVLCAFLSALPLLTLSITLIRRELCVD